MCNICRRRIGEKTEEILKYMIVEQSMSIEWMYGLPLCNFLMERSEPFQNIDDMSDKVLLANWRQVASIFHLYNVRKKFAHQHK